MATQTPDPLRQPVEIDLFEGPFDLLLTLVLREEVQLSELPLAELVEAALGAAGDGRWDPSTASELIVLLSALVELKLRRLLGEAEDEESDLDALEARERLAARLIAYAPFTRAAAWLAERQSAGGVRYRCVWPTGLPAPPPSRGEPAELAQAMAAVLATPRPSLAHMGAHRASVPEALERLRDAIASERQVSFDRLVEGSGGLREGVTLMAALELGTRGEARLEQRRQFGDILISRRP